MSISHTSKHFDAELERLRKRVLEMGGLVEQQIRNSVEALRTHDAKLAAQVIADEERVNRMEREIDEECVQLLARRAPAALDLRFVLMAYKVITDLERVGDEAKKIASMAERLQLSEHRSPGFPEIAIIAELVTDMLRRALDALARAESSDIPEVIRSDLEVNERFHAILRALLTYMIEDPRTISASIDTLWIAKALERIGDHAKNISEYAIYMIKGEDVRHASLEELERAAKS
ncbi:MAG TPA: phosphate signaling complex protein PhoU [Burkholderiales bacterium]|nr:phosphate signaling complex protein PhoU [Burkholderiales bacterium]